MPRPRSIEGLAEATPDILCTEDRRRIWRALQLGRQVAITLECRAIDRQSGEDYGCQIAAQELLFAGLARWRRGADWVLEAA